MTASLEISLELPLIGNRVLITTVAAYVDQASSEEDADTRIRDWSAFISNRLRSEGIDLKTIERELRAFWRATAKHILAFRLVEVDEPGSGHVSPLAFPLHRHAALVKRAASILDDAEDDKDANMRIEQMSAQLFAMLTAQGINYDKADEQVTAFFTAVSKASANFEFDQIEGRSQ